MLNWKHNKGKINPVERFTDVVKIYGMPKVLNKSKGGIAIWTKDQMKKKKSCYDEIYLKDESIPHGKPKPHADFLYTVVTYPVPPNKLMDVLGISQSIMYDQLKKQIIARCHFLGANASTIVLAMRIADGELTLKQLKKRNIYKKFIMATVPGTDTYNKKNEKMYEKEICRKIKAYKKRKK